LKNSNIKVKDIASLVGFASDGYFVTVFKKAEGISAIEYREQNSKRY
ncbi:MAG: AraC family transcriptional regulator, partial [Lachnospiraceae bacterium]|nr:AraC family transcriptional regulator [Lachnospiraceae bacterium]